MESSFKIGAFDFILCQVFFCDRITGKPIVSLLGNNAIIEKTSFYFKNYDTGIIIIYDLPDNTYFAYVEEFLPEPEIIVLRHHVYKTAEKAIVSLLEGKNALATPTIDKLIRELKYKEKELMFRKDSSELLKTQAKDSLMIKDIIE